VLITKCSSPYGTRFDESIDRSGGVLLCHRSLAATRVTAVPKSLAAALSPLLSGWLLSLSVSGWSFVIGGVRKGIYDGLIPLLFKAVRPPKKRSGMGRCQEIAAGLISKNFCLTVVLHHGMRIR
jgi:hypothetical protein